MSSGEVACEEGEDEGEDEAEEEPDWLQDAAVHLSLITGVSPAKPLAKRRPEMRERPELQKGPTLQLERAREDPAQESKCGRSQELSHPSAQHALAPPQHAHHTLAPQQQPLQQPLQQPPQQAL